MTRVSTQQTPERNHAHRHTYRNGSIVVVDDGPVADGVLSDGDSHQGREDEEHETSHESRSSSEGRHEHTDAQRETNEESHCSVARMRAY